MRIAKIVTLAAVAVSTSCVFADAANLLLSFSTQGPDKYADGATVVNGEWYALCWTTNDVFGGITTEFAPVVEGDRIMMAAPLAKSGRCPYTVFQVDSKEAPSGGKYFVYLLDTRDVNGKPAAKTIKDGKMTPALMNGAVASTTFTTSGGATSREVTEDKAAVAGAQWGETAVDTSAAGFTQAKIKAIQIVGDQVQITVEGMMPGIKYNIKAGEKVDAIESYPLQTPQMKEGEEANLFLDKNDGKFFQIVREPLKK